MFQTDYNHFLQSFSNDWLTVVMQFITDLGYPIYLAIIFGLLLFGINFKKGIAWFHVVFWTGLITLFAKEYFSLPRPFHVDSTLLLLDAHLGDAAQVLFAERDASSFWGLLPQDVVAHYRNSMTDFSEGFPSGHTSMAVAMWGALALLFRKKWLSVVCMALIVLVPFSRLYLGVHFLADVIGGYLLGGFVLSIMYPVILRPQKLQSFLHPQQLNSQGSLLLLIAYLVFLPFLMCFFLDGRLASFNNIFLGMNFGLLALLFVNKGLPSLPTHWQKRLLNMLLAMGFIGSVAFILSKLHFLNFAPQLIDPIRTLVLGFCLTFGVMQLSIKLRWSKK
ncbi:MAG: phosphatase PAP2 family protein [Chitinophagales bacterium]